jgi:spore germination protein GerM
MLLVSNNSISNYEHPLLMARAPADEEFLQGMPEDDNQQENDVPYAMSNLTNVPMTEEVLVTIPHPEVKLRSPRAQKLCF